MLRYRIVGDKSLAFITTALLSATALADISEVAPAPDYEEITGGKQSAVCAWPTAVSIAHPGGDCTATLVAPDVIVFAAHCSGIGGGAPHSVRFGENKDAPASTVGVSSCGAHPDWDYNSTKPGHDIAWCVLQSPITTVPIIPMIDGCEVETLQKGQPVTMVGFGVNDGIAPYGTKLEVEVPFNRIQGPELALGDPGGGKSIQSADSGGPAFVQLENGEWRMFGVASFTYNNQPGVSWHNPVWPFIGWLEEQTGRDLSPCFTDGKWDPNEDCGSIPLNPGVGGGAWRDGCPSDLGPMTSDSCEGESMESGEGDGGADDSSGDSDSGADGGADEGAEGGNDSDGGDSGEASGTNGMGEEGGAEDGGSGSGDDSGGEAGEGGEEEGGTSGGFGGTETGFPEEESKSSGKGCSVTGGNGNRLPLELAPVAVLGLFGLLRRRQ